MFFLYRLSIDIRPRYTIKGGSRRAEKSRKVLITMMKAAKLGWAGARQEKGWSKTRAGLKHEQGTIRAGMRQKQS